MKLSLSSVLLCAASVNGAYISKEASANGSDSWTTLTPSGSLSGATSSFDGSFALSIKTLSAASATSAAANATGAAAVKRDAVAQISDGQLQGKSGTTLSTKQRKTASVVNQISDGQVQQQTTADIVNQIGDGQVQQQTTADIVNQIGDGQVQQQTTAAAPTTTANAVAQISDGQIQAHTTASAIEQISDGQIQAHTTASGVNQISDGQLQAHTTASGVNQISDGQLQEGSKTTAAVAVSQISDGQAQATGSSGSGSSDGDIPETCSAADSLTLTLRDGVLRDGHQRIGAIVANHQFQFDGPPPQAGSIYAAGWSIVDGKLALGDKTKFYKCLSGNFYNLYDESIGGQCSEIEIDILKIVDC